MNFPEFEITNETGTPVFSYSYEGVCDNGFLIRFTEHLSSVFDTVMTPQEFKVVLFCSNELLQNIGFYSIVRSTDGKSYAGGIGKFSLDGSAEKITISSENAVSREQANKMTSKLDSYNALNSDELKAVYKQKLREESPDDSKGGGIGLIEILRKSKNPVLYSVIEKDNSIFLKLTITVRRTVHNE